MEIEEQVPDPQLLESMRSVGYSLEAALSDLIDNSLSANARNVTVLYRSVEGAPVVGVLDDGDGMNSQEARVALQLAGTNRGQIRAGTDLGRFGLGLKTASLSQARVLTLVTKNAGVVTALEWDLNFIATTKKWSMRVLDVGEFSALPLSGELNSADHGTLVLWRDLDLLIGDAPNVSAHLAERMAQAAEHLELVFHRFISGEAGHPAVQISINSRKLTKVDPFLENNPATQRSPEEVLGSDSAPVIVQAFTLPHLSKLSAADTKRARIGERMRDAQGFYVYRGRRLIEWGSWFRLVPKDELAKLARVRIDIPNSLDGEWGLDIKKSRAVPPESVRRDLRRLIDRIVGQSKTVHTYRGRPDETQAHGEFVWNVVNDRDSFRYEINREHPLFKTFDADDQPNVDSMFTLIEDTFPIHDLYSRMSRDHQLAARVFSDEFLIAAAQSMWALMKSAPAMTFQKFAATLSVVEPFNDRADASAWLQSNEGAIAVG
jgi:hypothetical protein